MLRLSRLSRLLSAVVLLSLPLTALAQEPVLGVYNPDIDVIQQSAAFKVFAEPGAPTMDVLVVQLGGPSALYRVGEETTLSELMVLSGQVSGTNESETLVTRSIVRVLRPDGQGNVATVYEAAPEALFREPGRHPALQSGDIVETELTYERRNRRISLREGIQIATSSLTLALTIIGLLTN